MDGAAYTAQVAGMADESPNLSRPPRPWGPPGQGPLARLELRHGVARPLLYEVFDAGFLIGSVPGCDLRLPGADLPPLLCLIAVRGGGLGIRKLVPTYPITINGQPLSSTLLADGDRITLGAVELRIHLPSPPATPDAAPPGDGTDAAALAVFRDEVEARARELDERRHQLDEQTAELETDRVIWYQRRDEIERDARLVREQQRELAALRADQESREQSLAQEREDLHRQRQELETQRNELAVREQEVHAQRQQLADRQRQLDQRYRERRDRLAGLQEAVAVAARKIQEQKRQLETETQQFMLRQEELANRTRELEERAQAFQAESARRTAGLDRIRQEQEDERGLLEQRRQELESQWEERRAQCDRRDQQLQEERRALEQQLAQYQADLVHLHRSAADLEEHRQRLQERAQDLDRRLEQLHQDSRELEDQARQLTAWRSELQAQAAQVVQERANVDLQQAAVARQAAALEDQQAALAALRMRWERLQEQVRREEQELIRRRARQEAAEAELRTQTQELLGQRDALAFEQQAFAAEYRQFAEYRATLETALVHLGDWQEQWASREEQLRLATADLDQRAARLAEETGQLQARSAQLVELQDRLSEERQALREREAALSQAESGQEALQEQLRRRSEELAERQRALAEQQRLHAEAAAGEMDHRAEWERMRQQAEEQFAGQRQELDQRAAGITQAEEALRHREEELHHRIEQLKESGRAVAATRKQLSEQRADLAEKEKLTAEALASLRADFEVLRREAADLANQLPQWETHSQTAAEHLQRAREQLRGHLGELHTYARQAQEDLEMLRTQVQAEAEKVRQQGLLLHRARDEHRLAVAAFRQQLLEWQGQVAEMRRSLSRDQSQLERRHAEVEATSARLAERAEQLQVQEREVTERRDEMTRHLAEMREWYRRKLRELTERFGDTASPSLTLPAASQSKSGAAAEADTAAAGILALTGDLDAGDRQLGDLLRSLELVDADTLAALLVEARKQRQSLRQVLLASGYVTLYQMALIEAGNLDGLMLGPVRVVDRLRLAAREIVYRVFDPRRGPETPGGEGYALLRHLTEAEMDDAVHPDEFRQRFGAAALLQHANLAATFEVLDIQGRPAVLQEWINGLPAPDWPALSAVPGVWFRLVHQVAAGLHAAHQAGLIHGHLHPSLLVLTGEGTLKICGLGEPLWLADPETLPPNQEATALDDLAALGRIAHEWLVPAGRRRGAGLKPLQAILERFQAEAPEQRYPDVAALLNDLDQIAGQVPVNPEAWERLVRHVRENARADLYWRQSA